MTPIEQMVSRNVVVETDENKGSGIILSTGLVLSVFHVLENNSTVTVDGKEAEVVFVRPEMDIVVLKTETREIPDIVFSTDFGVLTQVFQIGNPLKLTGVMSTGRVVFYDKKYLYLDTLAVKGFSGGGVYNAQGELLGIVQTMMGIGGSGSWIIRALKSEEIIKALEKK